ncbi:acyl carrier protein [Streptomyces sp. NBC_00885]|uniref:acyl carrier protein n=1 Tax=Streptomyces sp. NBC_00885 TaxID=2975857 RepID=UPI003869F645|nr:acyl carrier protein [Streptomyces sp. NBC_00885]
MTHHIITRDHVRATVRSHWADILEIEEGEINDSSHFFSDGGDSLLAVELSAAISDEFQAEVPVDLLFMDAGFSAFCEAVAGTLSDTGVTA